MSRVVEGFYVRFFWDWLAFISGAFRWKVFAVFADYVVFFGAFLAHFAGIVVFICAAVTFRTVVTRPAVLTPAAFLAEDTVRNTVDAHFADLAEILLGFTFVAGGVTFLANDIQTAGKSSAAGLAHIILLEAFPAVKTSQAGAAVRANGTVRTEAVFAYITAVTDISAALSAI